MSSDDNSEVEDDARAADTRCCASCGITEVDDITLKGCDDCDLVRYCSDTCQMDHSSQHEEECKKRAAELRDELLFRQPESSHLGDCPICCVPLPIRVKQSSFYSCCCKLVCNGCSHADRVRQLKERTQHIKCPFCRHPMPRSEEESDELLMKRAAANDPVVLFELGERHYNKGDYESAFKYYTKAAELGDADAHYCLSILYWKGEGVEKDESKETFHLEEAAIRGHPFARHNLGVNEGIDRSVKHLTIAASLGHDRSMKTLKEYYKHGYVSKEDFAAALRAHHAAMSAMKSPQRETAERVMAAMSKR